MENEIIQRSQSSVEISTNGKGEKSWKVKSYADTIDEAISLAMEARDPDQQRTRTRNEKRKWIGLKACRLT